MTAPAFVQAGAGIDSSSTSAALAVPYPASGIVTDHLFVMHCTWETGTGADVAPQAVTGWTVYQDGWDSNRLNSHIYLRRATGSETGTISVPHPGGSTAPCMGRMYQFSGASLDATLANCVEGYGTNAGSDASIEVPSLTTLGAERLAVALVSVSDDNAVASFTGETGGDWTEAVAEFTTTAGDDGCIQIQTAAMAAAGTISGGVQTMAAADPWFVQVFAILPATKGYPFLPRNRRSFQSLLTR